MSAVFWQLARRIASKQGLPFALAVQIAEQVYYNYQATHADNPKRPLPEGFEYTGPVTRARTKQPLITDSFNVAKITKHILQGVDAGMGQDAGTQTVKTVPKLPGGLAPIHSGSVRAHYYRKLGRLPKNYIGVADMTHYDDEKGTTASSMKEQKYGGNVPILSKTQIQSANLGIDDFIDVDTADARAEQLQYLLRSYQKELSIMNMQNTGLHIDVYVVVCRRPNSITPTVAITSGLQSEGAASTDFSLRPGILPWDSEEFNRFWKVKRRWQHYLEAGESFNAKIYFDVNRTFNAADVNRMTDTHIPGLTHYVFWRFIGQMVTEDGGPTEVSFVLSRLNHYANQKINYRVLFEENFDRLVVEDTALDDITTGVHMNVETHAEAQTAQH